MFGGGERVVYCRGRQSQIGGRKPMALQAHGFTVIEPGWEDGVPIEERMRPLHRAALRYDPKVYVGSSMGGAMLLKALGQGLLPQPAHMVLLNPATHLLTQHDRQDLFGAFHETGAPRPLFVLGAEDDVCDVKQMLSVADSILAPCVVIEGGNHRLDQLSGEALAALVAREIA